MRIMCTQKVNQWHQWPLGAVSQAFVFCGTQGSCCGLVSFGILWESEGSGKGGPFALARVANG
jgi:hypothetical protein